MKLNIFQKLLIVTVLPIITIIIFSISHFNDKYSQITDNRISLKHLNIVQTSSQLLHELQIERGLNAMYLNKANNITDKNFLNTQIEKTDSKIKMFFNSIDNLQNKNISLYTQKYIKQLKPKLENINYIRKLVKNKNIDIKKPFNYFTYTNNMLVRIISSFKIYTNSKEIEFDMFTLHRLIQFQELSGQERALVSNFVKSKIITKDDFIKFYNLVSAQKEEFKQLKYLLKDSEYFIKLKQIYNRYQMNEFNNIRDAVFDFDEKKDKNSILNIDAKKWFEVSTNRINEIHNLENKIFIKIEKHIKKSIEQATDSLVGKIGLTIVTILFLLFSIVYVAYYIKNDIKEIESGLVKFFNFLNYKTLKPKNIQTSSHDELYKIAQKINKEIHIIEKKFYEDKEFIEDTTNILKLMKDGDFSHRLIVNPNNPSLKELRDVLNELLELISQKIDEQTKSLEVLNTSLEKKVNEQTLKLQNQIEALNIAKNEAIEAQKVKDKFLTNMSNETKTPLRNIINFIEILNKTIIDTKSLSYLNIIDDTVKSLLNTIDDILQLSKLEKKELKTNLTEVNIVKELSSSILLFTSNKDKKYLTYNVYIDPKLPKKIKIDIQKVNQILNNLLSNAVKFTAENGTIKIYAIQEDNNLIISVKDNGIGISKEQQEKIFEAFIQSDTSYIKDYKGSGLGLSISAQLASLMNAQLTLKSEVGKGSAFTLLVPMQILDSRQNEYINKVAISSYTIAILRDKENLTDLNLIKKYLSDFRAKKVVFLDEYEDSGYDILFFAPNIKYNQKIIDAKIPAVAIVNLNISFIFESVNHIYLLHTPLTPISLSTTLAQVCTHQITQQKDSNNGA